jgi:DNA modification methylase
MTEFGFKKEIFLEEDAFEDEFDVEEAAESQEKITVKRGDVYLLGNHRLMCGDSTSENDIAKLMDGTRAELLFTSPPYADMREYEGGKDLGVSHLAKFIPAYKPYADIQCVNLGIQRKDNDIVEYWNEYINAARKCGLKLLAWNIWDKMGTGTVASAVAMVPIRHEWIFVFGDDHEFIICLGKEPKEINRTWPKKEGSIKKGKIYHGVRQADGSMEICSKGDCSSTMKKMESVVQVLPDKTMGGKHPAAFPVKLVAEYVKAFTDKGQAVVEPFSGSGTTIIACEELGRKCFAMEMEPKYVQVAIDRWEQLTGKKAVLINK